MKNEELENDQNNINQEEENEEEDNIKVFNGLISKDKKKITEKEKQTELTNQNSNNNQNSKKKTIKKNFEDFFCNNNSNIDLNLISFGELHSFNNFNNNSNNITSDINKNNNIIITKNILQDKIDEQIEENKSINIPEEILEINNDKNKNNLKTPIIVKENESKNYFRISSIEQGNALLVTGDDTIFTFPAYLLPKGAKLGETFTFEIKAINSSKKSNNIDSSKECVEIDNIQKKYIKENQDE